MNTEKTLSWTEKNVIKPFLAGMGVFLIVLFFVFGGATYSLMTYEPGTISQQAKEPEIKVETFEQLDFGGIMTAKDLAITQKKVLAENRDDVIARMHAAREHKNYGEVLRIGNLYLYAEDKEINAMLEEARTIVVKQSGLDHML